MSPSSNCLRPRRKMHLGDSTGRRHAGFAFDLPCPAARRARCHTVVAIMRADNAKTDQKKNQRVIRFSPFFFRPVLWGQACSSEPKSSRELVHGAASSRRAPRRLPQSDRLACSPLSRSARRLLPEATGFNHRRRHVAQVAQRRGSARSRISAPAAASAAISCPYHGQAQGLPPA